MFKNSIAVLSLVASVAVAQQSLIPSGISSKCADFFKSVNEDSAIAPCLNSLISATSAFSPRSTGAKSPSTSAVTSALSTLCDDSTKCSSSVMRTTLAKFGSECSSELQSGDSDSDTRIIYDYFFMLTPLREAVCSKDEAGSWCLTSTTKSMQESSKVMVDNYLVVQNRAVVNSTTVCSSNLPFAFIDPSLSSDKLCTTCTRNILTAYIDYESDTPYAPGLDKSKLLCGQSALYDAVTSKCPELLGGAVQAAGGLSAGFGSGSNAATSSFRLNMKGAVGAFMAVGALAYF